MRPQRACVPLCASAGRAAAAPDLNLHAATAPRAATRKKLGASAVCLSAAYSDLQHFTTPPGGVGWGGVIHLCANRARTQDDKRTRRQARDAGLSPSAGTSLLKRSAGSHRAVSMLVPLSEGSARAEQWELHRSPPTAHPPASTPEVSAYQCWPMTLRRLRITHQSSLRGSPTTRANGTSRAPLRCTG